MSLQAEFEEFGKITIGKGDTGKYRARWFEIDDTNIVHKFYEGSEQTIETIAHGLTFSKFVRFAFHVDEEARGYIILQTLTGYFKKTITWDYEANHDAFVKSGVTMSNVKFTLGNSTFKKAVWAFGDSYFGVNSERWSGGLKEMGYFNYYINAIAGQGSAAAFTDLKRSLNFGTSKYLLWCLGMNDTFSGWKTKLDEVISICKEKKITLIVSTIPTVPIKDNEDKNQVVKESGYRYLDFASAVGAQTDGTWYSGYLCSDNVHPSSLGAQALATQVIVDFPELMQYGNSQSGTVSGGSGNDEYNG